MTTVKEFQRGNYSIEKIIITCLVLLTKCQWTVRAGEFWPILQSTSIYIIIVKVVVNWLWGVIVKLVGPFKSLSLQTDIWYLVQSYR